MSNHPLFHRFLKNLRRLEISSNDHLLVAFSGGADSRALVQLLYLCQNIAGYELSVAHIHHGKSDNCEWDQFREKSLTFCREVCLELKVPFYTNSMEPGKALKSEGDMRDFRYRSLQGLRESISPPLGKFWIVLGQHRQDFLETQLIQLIRGTGAQGLGSLKEKGDGQRLRPLLSFSSEELEQFLRDQKIDWLEDPSNKNTKLLRNWIRHQWLPSLEDHRPGAVKSMARSLQVISEEVSDTRSQIASFLPNQRLEKASLLVLADSEQRRRVAQYFRFLGLDRFQRSHLEEFLKRIDTRQNELTFRLLDRDWVVGRDFIELKSEQKLS